MKIIPLAIPTPFYVGDVNVYLIKEDPLTLIDAGPKTTEAYETLREKLSRNGVRLGDIRRIVLTHAHEDHCGLAGRVRAETSADAEIFVHAWETGHLFGRLASESQKNLILRAGVPSEIFAELEKIYEKMSLLTDSLRETEIKELRDEQELEFAGGALRVLHTPGHTPGSCSLFREADRTVIAGDCVLKRITPNPILSPDPFNPGKRFKSLAEYLVSLARIRKLSPTLVYGGHGEPVTDFEEIFNRYVRSIDSRQKTVVGLVPSAGATAWQLAGKLFPDAARKTGQAFLALSETIAHLDFAAEEGKIRVETSDGIEFYRKP